MDYINGSEAIKIVRDLENNSKIKKVNIVSVTAFEDETSKSYIKKCGADFIINKPCSKGQVEEILKIYSLI